MILHNHLKDMLQHGFVPAKARSTDGGRSFDRPTTLGEQNINEGIRLQIGTAGVNFVYITWIANSFEEFAGRLLFAASSNAGETLFPFTLFVLDRSTCLYHAFPAALLFFCDWFDLGAIIKYCLG